MAQRHAMNSETDDDRLEEGDDACKGTVES